MLPMEIARIRDLYANINDILNGLKKFEG